MLVIPVLVLKSSIQRNVGHGKSPGVILPKGTN